MTRETKTWAILYYTKASGHCPAQDFLKRLKDLHGKSLIQSKLRKARKGLFGVGGKDLRFIREGLWELKVHSGPGYRLYFAKPEDFVMIILVIGTKRTQAKDIQKALNYLYSLKENL